MATFTIDLLTGNLYLFNGNFSGSGGTTPTSGSTYPEVNAYADLPAPASDYAGDIYIVLTDSGSWWSGKHDAGMYYSNGVAWVRLGNTPSYFSADNFRIYNVSDQSTGFKFITSAISAGVVRSLTIQNSDGTVAYLSDVNLKVNTSLFNSYTGATLILIGNKVDVSGDTMTGDLRFADSSTGDTFGSIGRTTNYSGLKIEGLAGVSLNTPYWVNPQWSGYTGAYLTVGIDGLITLTSSPTGATSWQVTGGSNSITANVSEDLDGVITLTSDVSRGTVEWNVNFTNTANQTANVTLQLIVNGTPYPEDTEYTVPKKETSVLYGTVPVIPVIPSGTTLNLRITSNKNGTVNRSLLRVSQPGSTVGTQSDLQEVTQVGATTNIESTFSSGLITNKIRPTGDSTTAFQIRKADNLTAVMNVDTISGFTGFGTVAPNGLVHAYGVDDSNAGDFFGLQKNSIIIDGLSTVDKDIVWYDNGSPKWDAQIFREEQGKFWYLYNPEGQVNVLTASQGGRFGINARTNILNYHVITISGDSIGVVSVSGTYNKNFISAYEIQIYSTSGTPNTFRWRVSKNLGQTYGAWSLPSGCTTGATRIDNGISVAFDYVTGFTVGDEWGFGAFPQLPSATFVVVPNRINEALVTDDYTATTIEYIDVTGDINSSLLNVLIPILARNTTDAAFYVGALSKINALYFNITTPAVGATLITEYWTGTNWVDISIGNEFYDDETAGLTQSGSIIWDTSTLTGWTKSYMKDRVENGYELYWLRFRTASPLSTSPVLANATRGGSFRLATYASPSDFNPAFYVNAQGRVNVGGGNITGSNKFQVNTGNNVQVTSTGTDSLVEFDSEDSSVVDLKIKLASDDACGPGLTFVKTRGTLDNSSCTFHDDILGRISFRGRSGTSGRLLAEMASQFTGSGTTRCGDIFFKTAEGSDPIERVRIDYKGDTGFGVATPSAVVHLKAGTTTVAPLKFSVGQFLNTPEVGVVEFDGYEFKFTVTGSTVRKTFAALESPVFVGTPALPTGTTLNSQNLYSLILLSGGTNSEEHLDKSEFYAYTASTAPVISTAVTGATNGLTKSGRNVLLGGNLTQDTVITGSTFNFTIGSKAFDLLTNNCINITDVSVQGVHIRANGGPAELHGNTSSGTEKTKLSLSETTAVFVDSRATPTGIEYDGDYSTTFTARSLVDKGYVDSHSGGLDPKAAVLAASQVSLNLSIAPARIDGVIPPNSSRILVKAQSNPVQNGIYTYTVSGASMTRTTDYASGSTQQGAYVAVLSGDTDVNTSWILSGSSVLIGTDPSNFVLFSSQSGVVAGNGICVTAGANYNVSLKLAANCGLCVDSSGLRINNGIAGTGLCYASGVMCFDGSGIAGNSLSWTGTQLAVNISGGTLSTALNSKLNTTVFNSYTGTTQTTLNNKLNTTVFNTYTGTTAPAIYETIANFNTYTGTTAPATYYTKSQINTYTANTATAIGLKANITSPVFLVSACAPTPVADSNNACIATTAFITACQVGTAAPLMDGSVCIGTSLRYSRQDHIHPSDTSRVNKAGDTMTGALVIDSNLTVTGTTILRGTTCLGTPTTASTVTDRTLFWNPTTCAIGAMKLTGGSDVYFYTDATNLCSIAAGTAFAGYLSGTPWTFKAGRYQVDFTAQYGNTTAAGQTCAQFDIDGVVIGQPYNAGGEVANWVNAASLSRDVTLTAGCHCLKIRVARGSNTACMTYGSIRAKRIC